MPVVSKGKFSSQQGVLILILFVMMTVASYYLFKHAFSFKYVQIDLLVAAVIFSFFFVLILLTALHEFQVVDVYEDHLELKWCWYLLPRKISKDDILLFSTTSKKNINYIVIRTIKNDVVLQETHTSNAAELVAQLNHWKLKRKNNILFSRNTPFLNKGAAVLVMLMAAFLTGLTVRAVLTPTESVDGNKMITLSGHLSMPADVHTPSGKSNARYIQLYLTEFPGINFYISSIGYNLIDLKKIKSFNRGALAELTIPRREYAIKIAKTEEPGYFEKHYQWTDIYTYAVNLDKEQLLTIDEYNESKQALGSGNKKWSILVIGLSLFMFAFALRVYQQHHRYHKKNVELLHMLQGGKKESVANADANSDSKAGRQGDLTTAKKINRP